MEVKIMKRCIVYSLRIANELVKMGYEIIETNINIQNPQYRVFFFEDTPEIRAEIAKLARK